MFLKANAYLKSHDEQTQWFYFLIENDDLLENYNTIWSKVSADIKNNFRANLSTTKYF